MAIRVRVDNRNKRFALNLDFFRRLAGEVLKAVRVRGLSELEIVFLSDKAIRPLNKKYMGKDRPTDVLSFNMDIGEFGRGKRFGEIFISSDTALKNSGIFDTSFEDELVLYVIHGILHLSGHEDYTPRDRARMSKKQEILLERICRKIDLSRALTIR